MKPNTNGSDIKSNRVNNQQVKHFNKSYNQSVMSNASNSRTNSVSPLNVQYLTKKKEDFYLYLDKQLK